MSLVYGIICICFGDGYGGEGSMATGEFMAGWRLGGWVRGCMVSSRGVRRTDFHPQLHI